MRTDVSKPKQPQMANINPLMHPLSRAPSNLIRHPQAIRLCHILQIFWVARVMIRSDLRFQRYMRQELPCTGLQILGLEGARSHWVSLDRYSWRFLPTAVRLPLHNASEKASLFERHESVVWLCTITHGVWRVQMFEINTSTVLSNLLSKNFLNKQILPF